MSTALRRRPSEEIDVAFNDKVLLVFLVVVKIIQNLFEAIVIITYIYLARSLWGKKSFSSIRRWLLFTLLAVMTTFCCDVERNIVITACKVYTKNIALLLLFLPIPSILGILMYSVRDLMMFTHYSCENLLVFVDIIQETGMFGGVLNLPNFIVDRYYATCYPKLYEIKSHGFPCLAVTMISIQIMLTGIMVVLTRSGVVDNTHYTIVFVSLCVTSVLVFAGLPFIAKRLHNYHRGNHSSVSIRYQSVQNIRVARLLNNLIVFYAVFYLAETAVCFVFDSYVADPLWNKILMSFYIMLVAVEVLSSILVITFSHSKLRSALPGYRKRDSSNAGNSQGVRSVDGRMMTFSAAEQQRIYFQSYRSMWNK